MGRFAIVVLCAAALGGLAALGLVDAIAGDTVEIGGIQVPVPAEQRIYDVAQLRIAAFGAALVAAAAAFGIAQAFGPRARRRR